MGRNNCIPIRTEFLIAGTHRLTLIAYVGDTRDRQKRMRRHSELAFHANIEWEGHVNLSIRIQKSRVNVTN